MNNQPVCVVIGVGPGNGAHIARKFSAEGYAVALCSRSIDSLNKLAAEIPGARAYAYDVVDTDCAASVFGRIQEEMGRVETLVYNAGAGQFATIDAATEATFREAWEVNTRGLFLASKAVLPQMRAIGRGNIIVIGATASVKAGAGFAPFASAKAAQRSLAQSMAKHLGPEKIHVAYVVVDGVIDLQRTRESMPQKDDDFFMQPDQIADAVFFLARQPSQARTFELDLRPYAEKW